MTIVQSSYGHWKWVYSILTGSDTHCCLGLFCNDNNNNNNNNNKKKKKKKKKKDMKIQKIINWGI